MAFSVSQSKMDDLELHFHGLRVADTRLRATKGYFDRTSGLLIIHGWLHLLSKDTVVELTIVDETDHLEWMCMTDPGQDEPFKMRIPLSSFEHRIVVTMWELRWIPDSGGGGTPDVTHSLVASERSCEEPMSRRLEIIDSVSPVEKCPISEDQPQVSADWIAGDFVPRAVLVIDSTNTYAKVHYWCITVTEVGDATNNSCRNVLITPWNGCSQRFEIPSNILGAGARYQITVEGLQLSEDGFDQFKVFRIVCRSSGILETSAIQAFHCCVDFNIHIERSTFTSASLLITTNPCFAPASRKWKIKIQKIAFITGSQNYYYDPATEFEVWAIGDRQSFNFPLQFHPDHQYHVTVERLELYDGIYPSSSTNHSVDFRAELTPEDIRELHGRAIGNAAGLSLPCDVLYRNKKPEYYDNIFHNRRGIMEVYEKDNSGDPGSPINLRINGLFFMASVDYRTRRPFETSYFGSKRISIPAMEMLRMASKLYFADYYCMSKSGSHHVTLVMTRPKSDADVFCESRLLALDVHDSINNPFLFYGDNNQLHVAVNRGLLVEVLFTENLNILGFFDKLQTVETKGKGSSTPGGKTKYKTCKLCNLLRDSSHPQF